MLVRPPLRLREPSCPNLDLCSLSSLPSICEDQELSDEALTPRVGGSVDLCVAGVKSRRRMNRRTHPLAHSRQLTIPVGINQLNQRIAAAAPGIVRANLCSPEETRFASSNPTNETRLLLMRRCQDLEAAYDDYFGICSGNNAIVIKKLEEKLIASFGDWLNLLMGKVWDAELISERIETIKGFKGLWVAILKLWWRESTANSKEANPDRERRGVCSPSLGEDESWRLCRPNINEVAEQLEDCTDESAGIRVLEEIFLDKLDGYLGISFEELCKSEESGSDYVLSMRVLLERLMGVQEDIWSAGPDSDILTAAMVYRFHQQLHPSLSTGSTAVGADSEGDAGDCDHSSETDSSEFGLPMP